jgi:methionine-rich copper-binding protein CopC
LPLRRQFTLQKTHNGPDMARRSRDVPATSEIRMRTLQPYALAAVLSLAGAGSALAHADLASADPAAGATVKTAPTEISITFTEEVEPKFSTIQVLDGGGKRVDDGKAHTAPDNAKLLSVGLKPLAPGTYKVMWHAMAADDSHKTKGSSS